MAFKIRPSQNMTVAQALKFGYVLRQVGDKFAYYYDPDAAQAHVNEMERRRSNESDKNNT